MKVIIANPDGGPLMCAPDSAVIASGTPFFCPDEPGAGLHCRLLAGAVIERLGKNIQPRFAARYYSRTVLLVQTVAACDDSLTAILRDGSITAGREPVGEEGKIALELTVGAEPPVAMEAEPEMPDLDAAIASLVAQIDPAASEYDKALYVYDWLQNNVAYYEHWGTGEPVTWDEFWSQFFTEEKLIEAYKNKLYPDN